MFDLLIQGGICITPSGRERVDIGITAGRISAIGHFSPSTAASTLAAAGLHVLPGVIDTQVHFREPGLTHKEDIGSGSASAALGGVTAFFEMPNTKPSTDSAEQLAWKVARAKETSWTDFAFYVGATNENVSMLAALEAAEGAAGVKMFMGSSTGSLLVDDPRIQEQVLRAGRRRVACHSEDERRLQDRKDLFTGHSVTSHPDWRDEAVAIQSTKQLLSTAKKTNRRVHVLHVATAEELELLRDARDIASVEVTPQHLTLAAPDCYERLGSLAQMNPPIRGVRHREALWKAVACGLIDVLGSDHAPHTLEEKSKPWPQSPSGMPGVQTLVPLMLDHVHHERLTLERFVDLTSAGPARLFGIRQKGRIAVGYDADFSLVDLKAERSITNDWSKSRCAWTPFDGMKVTGWPMATVIRGRIVMRDGALVGSPGGMPISFDG